MTPEQIRALATRIADDLFTTGFKEEAYRLKMVGSGNRDLGGWSKPAAIERIVKVLEEANGD